jgi:hypothetical protein
MEDIETQASALLSDIIKSLSTLIDNHKQADKEWFQRLLDCNKGNSNPRDIEAGITINITIIDCIVAKLLDMDFRQLAKAKIVKDYISQMWIDNGCNLELLNSHIIDDSKARDFYNAHSTPINTLVPIYNNSITTTSHETTALVNFIPTEELPLNETDMEEKLSTSEDTIIEISMEGNNIEEQIELSSITEQNEIANMVLGQDILSVSSYDTRNRTSTGINPFFVTKKGKFKAGAITANIPGDNGLEQLSYMAHLLKVAKNSDLIKYDFHKGNSWITFNFDTEEDIRDCISKLNGKNHEQFQIYQLNPELNNKTQQHQKELKKPSPIKKTEGKTRKKQNESVQTIRDVSPNTFTDCQETHQEMKKDSLNHANTTNPFNLLSHNSRYKAGFSIEDIPGKGRLEQLVHISSLLSVPLDSDFIRQDYLDGKGWLTVYFSNQADLAFCVKQLATTEAGALLTEIKVNKNKGLIPENNQYVSSESDKQIQVQIIDIPSDFSSNRIKGALKHYGKIENIRLSTNKVKGNKSALVYLRPNKNSKNLNNTWSIPMGNTMARVAINNNDPNIFAHRNKFTARLHGINSDISPTRIMSLIKHTGAKSCHIPTNSATLRKRGFAIVGFQSKTELKCAIRNAIYLDNKKLKWTIEEKLHPLGSQNSSSSSETSEPIGTRQTNHVTVVNSQWKPNNRRNSPHIRQVFKGKESHKENIAQAPNTTRRAKQEIGILAQMECSSEDSNTELFHQDTTDRMVINNYLPKNSKDSRRRKQKATDTKSSKPCNYDERHDQSDSSLSVSLAILIKQINSISSRLENIEACQTLPNRKKSMVAPNRS